MQGCGSPPWGAPGGSVAKGRHRGFGERESLDFARRSPSPAPHKTKSIRKTTRYPRVKTLRHVNLRAVSDARQLRAPAPLHTRARPPFIERQLTGAPSYSLNVNPKASWRDVPSQVSFADPARIVACVRRKRRAEVLHALNKTGRGSGSGKKRRTYSSDISCR